MPATAARSGHTGLQQRHRRRADRAHRGRAVGAHRLGELADGVGELVTRRQHRQQGAARERTVADLAALRRADPAGLTGGERREDVLVHVATRLLRGERVELLLQGQHVEGGDTQDLGLATLEQRRAVHPRDHADLGVEVADVGEATAVHADLVAQDALADQLLGQRAERGADLLLATLELTRRPISRTASLTSSSAASRSCLPVIGRAPAARSVDGGLLDGGVHVVLVVEEDREVLHRLGGLLGQLGLRLDELLDERLGGLETTGDDLLGRRLRGRSGPGPRSASVASASTIMMATSPVSVTRPATTMSKTASSSWLWVGNATH